MKSIKKKAFNCVKNYKKCFYVNLLTAGDHVVLLSSEFLFRDVPQVVCMRTLSEEKESPDSNLVHLSDQYRQEISKAIVNGKKSTTASDAKQVQPWLCIHIVMSDLCVN